MLMMKNYSSVGVGRIIKKNNRITGLAMTREYKQEWNEREEEDVLEGEMG